MKSPKYCISYKVLTLNIIDNNFKKLLEVPILTLYFYFYVFRSINESADYINHSSLENKNDLIMEVKNITIVDNEKK